MGMDLASVNAAVVAIPMTGPEDARERVVTAPPKDEVDSPIRDLVMAQRLCDAVDDLSVFAHRNTAVGDYVCLGIEHTPFSPHQVGSASTGIVRGALYSYLHGGTAPAHLVFLVNPSQWRGFHGITATRGDKIQAYADKAAMLGFVSRARTVKGRVDATTAFLIADFARALAVHSVPSCTDGTVLTPKQTKILDGIVANPNMRIYPE